MTEEMGLYIGRAPADIQAFAAGLAGLPKEEVRKAKLLFLRNEMAQLRAIRDSNSAWRIGTILMFLMPLCWPVLYAQRRTMKVNAQLQEDRIRNALSVWAYDLDGNLASLRQELDETSES